MLLDTVRKDLADFLRHQVPIRLALLDMADYCLSVPTTPRLPTPLNRKALELCTRSISNLGDEDSS